MPTPVPNDLPPFHPSRASLGQPHAVAHAGNALAGGTVAPRPFAATVAELRRRVRGAVVTPEETDEYDQARAAWNLTVEQRPAVIVVATEAADVAETVRFARSAGYRVAIQATGHGIARPADGAVLIVTSRMNAVSIDPEARTATVQAGAKWGAVLAPAQEHGLAPLLGSTTDVGAVGYVLGGGMGWLARHYGLGSDSVRSFELVTPDGIEVHCDALEQRELFWALKGGGAGSLGVVTSMEIDLYPVSTVYAGNLLYPIEMAVEVTRRWRDWVAGMCDELTSSVVVMNFPPLDIVPEPLRGRSFVIVRGCWSGDLEAGKTLVDEWRTWRAPVLDMFGPMPFAMSDAISQDPVDPMPAMVTTESIDELSDELIGIIVQSAVAAPGNQPPLAFVEIRHAGGAVRARSAAAANDRVRDAEFVLELVGVVMDAHHGLALEAHLRHTRRKLAPHVTGAAYLNFTEGTEKQERSASAFRPEHLARVQAVKAALDVENRFCHGVAITA